MSLSWSRPHTTRRAVLGLVLGGGVGGALTPVLSGLSPAAPGATLALSLALGGALLRGGAPPAGLLVSAVGVLGGLASLLDAGPAPAGLGYALLGLAVGLALSSAGRGAGERLLEALPHAAGAILGGIAAGALATGPALAGLPAAGASALLGGVLGLGVALGELGRGARLVPGATPAWASRALAAAGPEARPLLSGALDAHARLVGAVRATGDPGRREALRLGGELIEAAARSASELDRAARALAGLMADDPVLAGHAELERARGELRQALLSQRDAAREQVCARTAELLRLVVTVSTQAAARERDQSDLEARLRELERAALLGGNP